MGAHEPEIKNSLITAQATSIADSQFLLLTFISQAHMTVPASTGVK